MPELTKVLTEDDLTRGAPAARMDLSAYLAMIDAVASQRGLGGVVTLAEDESQRTEKRRLSLAAKEQGYRLTWRRSQSGELRFVLAAPGASSPGGRRRREQPPEPAPEPAPAARGRRRTAS